MSEAKKLVEQCKQILRDAKLSIKVLESMSPEDVLQRMRALSTREKALLLSIIRREEISEQTKSVRRKSPTYIF
ncbi:MAG: hypothetical protein NWE76_02120 [Candidatus Bathyarchaeota archaeon]|nr:hypothetical protein [Candidatus Bathyarchaeota archaeon]